MKIKALCVTACILPSALPAWEIYQDQGADGDNWTMVEQIGEAGSFLNFACNNGVTHIEVVLPFSEGPIEDLSLVFQVDSNPERLVAGFVEEIDSLTSVFVGIDRRGFPAVATSGLLAEIAAGNELYLGDPDRSEAIERWSLKGSSKAISDLKTACS